MVTEDSDLGLSWKGRLASVPSRRDDVRSNERCAAKDSDWFAPSTGAFMINYRVDDMDGIMKRLKDGGVPIFKGPEYAENGAFLWGIDPDGNKVELWEPKNWDDKNKR